MKYIWICSEANTWSSYYYDELTEEFFVFDNKKGGNGLTVGVLSGISLMIYALVRKIEKPIPFDKNLLYWISLGLGVIVGVCAGYRFLMIWIVPSVPVYAFFNSVMCMITVLLITGFVGNHPLKGWRIAGKILKGE